MPSNSPTVAQPKPYPIDLRLSEANLPSCSIQYGASEISVEVLTGSSQAKPFLYTRNEFKGTHQVGNVFFFGITPSFLKHADGLRRSLRTGDRLSTPSVS